MHHANGVVWEAVSPRVFQPDDAKRSRLRRLAQPLAHASGEEARVRHEHDLGRDERGHLAQRAGRGGARQCAWRPVDELDALMADAAAADKKVSAWLLAWVFGAPKICEGARISLSYAQR